MESFLEHVEQIGDLELCQGLTLPPAPWLERRYQGHIKANAFYLDEQLAGMVNAGDADYTPVHYSDLPDLYREGTLPVDVALIMVSPPDAYGYCSLGPSVEWTPAALETARLVIAQINPLLPRTNGLSHIHISRIDYAIEASMPLPELALPKIDAVHRQIGEYAAQLIKDGDTLQFGVGSVGAGLALALGGHKHLGIHSEVIGDGVMELFERGIIDNSRKSLLPGKIVTALGLGTECFYAFLNTNPHVDFRPTEFVNNPLSIARNERMVSINGALLSDVTGQVVVDSVRGLFRSGVGSMVDFVRGAAMSKGGRPIIALPSSGLDANGDRFSRIVTDLPMGAGVGCHRSDVHFIVTEWGIASLRGRTIQERVQELIQIAHPDFREALLREARMHHLLPSYFQLPPPYLDAIAGIDTRKLRLKDDREYLLRPLGPADERRLQTFFYSHSEETIMRRYGFTVSRMSRERAFEMVSIDQNRDVALAIVELQGPRQLIHAVGRYYLDTDRKGAEMAFVVAENKRRLGMAKVLLERLYEIAGQRGLNRLWAQVDRDNSGMLALFRKFGATESPGDDLHTVEVNLPIGDSQEANLPARKPFLSFGNNKHRRP
jgi:acyl-CoA hydrolase/GNAT superfamily N-acetyltransferase